MNLSPALILTNGVDKSKMVMGVRIIRVSIEIGIQKLGRLFQQRLAFSVRKLSGIMEANEAIKHRLSEVIQNWGIGRVTKITASQCIDSFIMLARRFVLYSQVVPYPGSRKVRFSDALAALGKVSCR
jgi:hypothetical protein